MLDWLTKLFSNSKQVENEQLSHKNDSNSPKKVMKISSQQTKMVDYSDSFPGDTRGPFEVPIPHEPYLPVNSSEPEDDWYNKKWIHRFWKEGQGVEAICHSLEIHEDEVFRLANEMGLSWKSPKCSQCGFRGHNKRNCPG